MLEKATKLTKYLKRKFPARIETVSVSADAISLTGKRLKSDRNNGRIQIVEVPPWAEATSDSPPLIVDANIELQEKTWTTSVPRFDGKRDRLNSSWRLMSGDRFVSARRFPTEIEPLGNNYIVKRPEVSNQKGLGGLYFDGPPEELVELGITAVTVNFKISDFLINQPGPGREQIELPSLPDSKGPAQSRGSPVYFNTGAWKQYDNLIDFARQKKFVVSAIILIPRPKVQSTFAPLVHPDNDGGIFSMPNLTDPQAAWLYDYALNRVAERYSNPNKAPGGITNWIAHNEVDQHYIWTNMGKQPRPLVTEAYYRSLRMIYNAARNYNPHARVFASLTHSWNVPDKETGTRLAPRDMLVTLQRYCILEGDFEWGVAYHPYAQSLFAATAWQDTKVSQELDTPLITMQNIEVLGKFLTHSFMRNSARQTRPVLLSEQGFHTASYSAADQANQAGSLAYAMRKIKQLPFIETFHYHRWIDNPNEGGLKLGLRTLPTADHPHGQKKQAWHVFKAIGTPREAEVTNGLPRPTN